MEVVLHCAATVRFDEDLSKALRMNVGAVASLIEICRKMQRLSSVVHVSTAYCHCQRKFIEETSYPPPSTPKKALSLLECLDSNIIDDPKFTKMIIGDRPNTYTYTKVSIIIIIIISFCQAQAKP